MAALANLVPAWRHRTLSPASTALPSSSGNVLSSSLRPDTFFNDSSASFNAATDCERCSAPGLIRDVWGLLVYPAGPPDTYYRVGAFFSRTADGGSEVLRDAEECSITLV